MPNKRPSMEFRRRQGNSNERCGRDKRGECRTWRTHMGDMTDLIMIKEPLAGLPPSSYFPRRRGGRSMSDIFS